MSRIFAQKNISARLKQSTHLLALVDERSDNVAERGERAVDILGLHQALPLRVCLGDALRTGEIDEAKLRAISKDVRGRESYREKDSHEMSAVNETRRVRGAGGRARRTSTRRAYACTGQTTNKTKKYARCREVTSQWRHSVR